MDEKKITGNAAPGDTPPDWEYMDDYYSEVNRPLRTLEDYLTERNTRIGAMSSEEVSSFSSEDKELHKTVQDVRRIRILSEAGKKIEEICLETDLDKDYVIRILMTLEGYAEDDDFAIAHLVSLG